MADVNTNAPQEPENKATQENPKVEPKKETTVQENPKTEQPKEKEPTIQELMVEVAKLKREKDKASSEAADFKKKWKDSMTEQEKVSVEKAEAQAKRDEEFEQMKKTIQIHDLTENFMDLGYPKDLAKKAATAQAEGDTATLLDIQKQFNDFQKKQWEAEFYASRPDANIGGSSGKTYSKEDFDKMSMVERTKLKRENEAEYRRLLALK